MHAGQIEVLIKVVTAFEKIEIIYLPFGTRSVTMTVWDEISRARLLKRSLWHF